MQDCPIGYLIPDGRKAYIVPKEYRPLLAHIVKTRDELNHYLKHNPHYPYYEHSCLVEESARDLDNAMRLHSRTDGVIEYHKDWLYSVLSYEDILREHREFEEKNRPKNTGGLALDSGLSYAYLDEPPEICTLWAYMSKSTAPD